MKTPLDVIDSLGGGVIDIIKEAVPDKDKQVEYAFKALQLQSQAQAAMLRTQTIPWVDASVKVIVALQGLLVSLFRPLGSALIQAFGMWLLYEGVIEADQVNDSAAVIGGAMQLALPAWGTSRHLEKARKEKEETTRERYRAIAKAGSAPKPGMFEH